MNGHEHAIETLEALRAEHGRLLKQARVGAGSEGLEGEVTRFLVNAERLGRRLDDPADREAAQSVLDYWTATLFTLPGGVAASSPLPSTVTHPRTGAVNVQLDEFDPATIRAAAAAADQWVAGLPADDPTLTVARRVALRLVRMAADGGAFESVPAVRAALYDVDASPGRVDDVIRRLAAAGVVRVVRGDTPETDQVTLRSPTLRTDWTALRGWLAERSAFRDHVASWDHGGRPVSGLWTGDALEEARSYHDRNVFERQFTEESRKQEIWINERDRRLKYVFGALALALLAGLAGTGLFALRSNSNWKLAEKRGRILEVRQRFSETNALVRSIALLGNSTGAEREVAYERLDAIRAYKSDRPEIRDFFDRYGPSLKKAREQGTERDLEGVKRAALNLARSYKGQVLQAMNSAEANESLSAERKAIYAVVKNCASRIVEMVAEGRPYHDADPYVKEFFVLYWGEMGIFEGEQVQSAMVRFGNRLKAIDRRIADKVRNRKDFLKDPAVLKSLTDRQAVQRYFDEAKFAAKSELGLEGFETVTVDSRKELPLLREDLQILKRALAAEQGRPLEVGHALDDKY